jgi:hypothetical protein
VFAPCRRLSTLLSAPQHDAQQFLGVAYHADPPDYGKVTAPTAHVLCTHQQPYDSCRLCSLRPRV